MLCRDTVGAEGRWRLYAAGAAWAGVADVAAVSATVGPVAELVNSSEVKSSHLGEQTLETWTLRAKRPRTVTSAVVGETD